MTRPTFTWHPEWDSQLSEEPDITVTKFGDGYELRVPKGINNRPEKWSLTFSRTTQQFPDVLTFVRARNGVESFYWTTPLGETKVFVCRSWRLSRKQGHNAISLEFEQVFEA